MTTNHSGQMGLDDPLTSAQHASHQVVLVPVHERVLAKLPTADLAVLLEDVLDHAGLVLQGVQRHDIRVKRLTSHALQLHIEDRLRHAHRTSEAYRTSARGFDYYSLN